MLMMLPDFAFTYFLLAPSTARVPGLGLGAVGAALRITVLGLVGVQLYQRDLVRSLGGSYRRVLKQQLIAALVAGGCAVLALAVVGGVLGSVVPLSTLSRLSLASVVYGASIVAVVAAFPEIVSSSKAELMALIGAVMSARVGRS
jgi:hypothetical protein